MIIIDKDLVNQSQQLCCVTDLKSKSVAMITSSLGIPGLDFGSALKASKVKSNLDLKTKSR